MDKIYIKNLEIFANHGVYKAEKQLGQKFIVSSTLYTDFSQVVDDEDLTKSIHYGEASKAMTVFMQENTFDLIETAAVKLAEHMLINTPNLLGIDIEVKKPWAPLKYSLETVSTFVHRQWHKAYLSVGSNMGDRNMYLGNAMNALKGSNKVKLNKISPIYETAPYGGVEQQNFLNACLEIDTIMEPLELLRFINKIEADNNRERLIHWGPRTLDMDIILYDDLIMHTEKLCIPHVDMHNRAFVLEPLNDIAPYAYNPVVRKTVAQLLADLKSK